MKIEKEQICWFTLPEEESLDEGLQKLFAKAREKIGFVPNVFVAYSFRPTHFWPWFTHFRELTSGESDLSSAEREMISVVVSSENHCLYCLVSHGADLRAALEDPVLGDRITLDYRRAGLDERTTAMLDYAVKITLNPVECNQDDIEHLRQLGFSDEAIFDIAEIAAMYNFTNRLAAATGMMPNREYHTLAR
ncbi:MAG: peroxidase-related enzyme [Chloroflexi bacterium]|nr:peroxidase-related enzyme [Chloroflexota bacterium]